jgi:hypothetical protein
VQSLHTRFLAAHSDSLFSLRNVRYAQWLSSDEHTAHTTYMLQRDEGEPARRSTHALEGVNNSLEDEPHVTPIQGH